MIYSLFKNLSSHENTLRLIEAVISIGIIWRAFIAIVVVDNGFLSGDIKHTGATAQLIEKYEIVSVIMVLLAIVAILDLFALSYSKTRKNLALRSRCMMLIAAGSVFLSILLLLGNSGMTMLLVGQITTFFITSILYLNIGVSRNYAKYQ